MTLTPLSGGSNHATWRLETAIAGILIVTRSANLPAQRPLTPIPEAGQEAITGKFPTVRHMTLKGAARVSVGLAQNSWRELRLRISVENLTPTLLEVRDLGMTVLDGDRHRVSPAPHQELERRIERNLAVPPPGPPPAGYHVSGDIDASITPDLSSRFYWVRTARRYREAQETAWFTEKTLAELRKRQGDWEHPLVPDEVRDGEFWFVPDRSANLSAVTVVLVLPEDDQANSKAEFLRFRFQGLEGGTVLRTPPNRRNQWAH